MNDSIRERLLKVLRLAQGGVGGEKENAEALLAKLLIKHGISRRELEETAIKPSEGVWLKHGDDNELAILFQLVARICGKKRKIYNDRTKRRTAVIEVTHAEGAALTIAWDVYRAAWKAALEDLVVAFCWKHKLHDPDTDVDDHHQPDLSAEDLARAKRAAAMVSSLQHVDAPLRRIGAGV